jgi:hypothetical protein
MVVGRQALPVRDGSESMICAFCVASSSRVRARPVERRLVRLSPIAFGVEDAEYFIAEPAVPDACASAFLAKYAVRGEASHQAG